MANLGDLAALAALVYGVKAKRRDNLRLEREKRAQQEEENKHRTDLLNYRIGADANERRQAEEAAKQKAATARAAQLRQAYTPLLQMGRTPADQAELSRNPERYQALLADQADIAQLLASGDDNAWESFRPRFWGGQGFVAPPPGASAPAAAQVQSIWDAAGAAPQAKQPSAPQPPPMMTTDPLGNPLPQPMPMTPGAAPSAPPQGQDPLGNPLLANPFRRNPQSQTTLQPPSWFGQAVPQPLKDAATTENLRSQTKERDATLELDMKKIREEIKVARANGDLAREKQALTRAHTVIAQGTPAWKNRQLAILEKTFGLKVRAQGETERSNRATERLTERGQNLANEQANARLNAAEARLKMVQDPLRRMAYQQAVGVLLGRTTDPARGVVWKYPDAERQTAADALRRMAAEDGQDFSGIGIAAGGGGVAEVDSLMGGLLGGGPQQVPSAPTGGGSLPAGLTEAQVQAVAGLSSADYNAAFAAATPDEKRLMKAARAEALRRKPKGR